MARSANMVISFEQGLPNKFFPGYPLLLSIPSLFAAPDVIWPYLQTVLYLLCVGLFGLIVRMLTMSTDAALACAALLASNSIFNKWVGLPAAETSALFWLLAGALLYLRLKATREAALAAGLSFGIGVLTRPDAAYFIPAALAAAYCFSNLRPRFINAVLFLILGFLPPLGYFILHRFAHNQDFSYVTVLQTSTDSADPFQTFLTHGVRLLRQPRQLHHIVWINRLIVGQQLMLMLMTLLCLLGIFGRGMVIIALCLLGYLICHSLWYYSSERFNVLALPLVPVILVISMYRLLRLARTDSTARRFLFTALIIAACTSQVIYSPVITQDHQEVLNYNAGKLKLMAQVASTKAGLTWSEAGPDFAYYYPGPVYMDRDEPYFYKRVLNSPASLFDSGSVTWVLLQSTTVRDWFSRYPEMHSRKVQLVKRTNDGVHTLYEVRYNP